MKYDYAHPQVFFSHFLISQQKQMPKGFISVANVGRKVLGFAEVARKTNANIFEIISNEFFLQYLNRHEG